MFNKILVALDGSERSDQILNLVRLLIRSGRVEHVYLVQVVDPNSPYETLEAARDRLLVVGKGLSPREVIIDVAAIRGEPASEIFAAVERLQPSLLAMSTRGQSGFSRLLHGSVTEQVLRHCHVPLLLVNSKSLASGIQSTAVDFHRVLVPLEGSCVTEKMQGLLENLREAYDARVTLLQVEETGRAPRNLEEELESCLERLEDAGVPAELKVTYGARADEIIEAAKDADLVAMTTRDRSRVSRWWSSSVMESVIHHCPTPILVCWAQEAA